MKKIKLITYFFVLFFISICVTNSLATELPNINTMQATFRQNNNTKGKMFLSRPGKFRWEVLKPEKQLIIVNNNYSWFYDEQLEQAIKQKINNEQPQNPAVFLSSTTADINKIFIITKIKCNKQNNNNTCFKLTPKISDDQTMCYKEIKLYFNNEKLQEMEVLNNIDNQITHIYFDDIQLNISIPENKFIFIPNSKTDIIYE